MPETIEIRCLETLADREIQGLCDVLIDCVEGGASVSFMLPMSRAKAQAYWRAAAASVTRGELLLLAAADAAALLAGAERAALSAGKTLLVLDTASGDAQRLYARHGWQRCGQIPHYALWPDGAPCATTIFFKFQRS